MPTGFKEFGELLAKATIVLIPLASCTPNLNNFVIADGNPRLSCLVVERIAEVEISDEWQSIYLPDEFKLTTNGNKHLLSIGDHLVVSDPTTTKGSLRFVIKELPTSTQKTTTIHYLVKIDRSSQPATATLELRPNNLLKLMTGKAICKTG